MDLSCVVRNMLAAGCAPHIPLCHHGRLDLVGTGRFYNVCEMSTSLCIVTLSFHAAKQVLGHFQSQFIQSMDANAIVHDLVHKGIIGNHDLTIITRKPDARQQNQYLHACLLRTCDEEALVKVCDIVVEQVNPRMKALGEDMKSMLEGKCCVQVFIHAHCMLSVYLTQSLVLISLWSLPVGPAGMSD